MYYFIKEAFRGFFQAKLMTFASIVTIAFSLFLLGGITIVLVNVHSWLKDASEQAGVVVYLDEEIGRDSAASASVIEQISQFPHVKSTRYIDKHAAWGRFEDLYGSEMLEAVDENPLPASIEIILNEQYQSRSATEEFKREVEQIDGVEGLHYSRDWFIQLERFRSYLLWGTLILVVVIAVALNFIISNTIKLTIYARRDLVTNMHFVGATDLYIKMPFILEGMLQGFIGGLFALLLLEIARFSFSSLDVMWGEWHIQVIVLITGVVFGWIGSLSAVRKFLV
jgi:cell division transport system permease protein